MRQNLVDFMAVFLSDSTDPSVVGRMRDTLKRRGLHGVGADDRTLRQLLKTIKLIDVECSLPESRTRHPTPRPRTWVLKGFDRQNRNAAQYMFDCALEQGQPKVPMTIAEYYEEKYGLQLEYPLLPVVNAGGSTSYVPAEFLTCLGTAAL